MIVLDSKWMVEKVYGNNLTNLAVDSLNLSSVFKENKRNVGKNDIERRGMLDEIENNISNPNRYFEFDFQLVDDAIEAAKLSRMLELPKDEVIGKFDRALRLGKKVDNERQWSKIYYQFAWTALNWYDDYSLFFENYREFKKLIHENSGIDDLENLFTLYTLTRNVGSSGHFDLKNAGIELDEERKFLMEMLGLATNDDSRPARVLSARSLIASEELFNALLQKQPFEPHIKELIELFNKSEGYLDYDFDSFKNTVLVLGDVLSGSRIFDELVDTIASVTEKRTSQVAAGRMYFKRATQKYTVELYKDAIIYYGKAVLKLAKEESQEGLYLSLRGLGDSYSHIGLLWASNHCLIAATSIAFKPWFQPGILTPRAYRCIRDLARNEAFIGRIPSLINWYELLKILELQINLEHEEGKIPDDTLIDSCLAIRILNTDHKKISGYLPEILNKHGLWMAEDAALYSLGHIDVLIDPEGKGKGIESVQMLHDYFDRLANQPFKEQMVYPTKLMDSENLEIESKILGCNFTITFKKDTDLVFVAETIFAFLESFLATSLEGVYPGVEQINILLVKTEREELFTKVATGNPSEFQYEIGRTKYLPEDTVNLWEVFLGLLVDIIGRNFFIKDVEAHLEHLFAQEEIKERVGLIFEHWKFSNNILGDKAQLFLADRIKNGFVELQNLRNVPPNFTQSKTEDVIEEKTDTPPNFDMVNHQQRNVHSIIDNQYWDDAGWSAFGNAMFPDGKLVLFLAYKNIAAGKKIFDSWIKKFGKVDKDEVIRVTIIRGIDANHPHYYKIDISKALDFSKMKRGGNFSLISRGLGVHPESPQNLNNLINAFEFQKKYLLCPASFDPQTGKIELVEDMAILKTELVIKQAWEIGLQDTERSALMGVTNPVIPLDRKLDAPILAVLKARENYNDKQ